MHKIVLGLLCYVVATLSYADNCDKTRNTYDDIYCTNKIYASADADLNKNYEQLRKHLNETQQKILKKSQLAWIRHRDASCTDSQQNSVDVECRLSTTQERNHWLLERLRECQTVGCKTTRLSE
ncbi:lysozyme inhibitor LprI family protein [Acinetobacter venetianus]|uniref:lysozyme inhibitor LprI family protein n=1 Tax=Acinetobacter venetianus TaxID=52133 RepID=UPI0028992A7E|nr:lysozyme inhibitor LprI family protein [Acinetobacter venetianus]